MVKQMEKDTAVPDRTVLQKPTTGDCDQVWGIKEVTLEEMKGAGDSFPRERERERGGHAGKRRGGMRLH